MPQVCCSTSRVALALFTSFTWSAIEAVSAEEGVVGRLSRNEVSTLEAALEQADAALGRSVSVPKFASLLAFRKGQRVARARSMQMKEASPPVLMGASQRERHADEFLENEPGKGGSDHWSGIVLGFVMIGDTRGQWNREAAFGETETKDLWMQEILSLNRAKAKRHGYRMAVRTSTTLGLDGLTPSQLAGCKEHDQAEDWCREFYQRQNHNWEKEAMISDYLNQTGVKYVLVMDGDAAMVHPKADTIRMMADELKRTGRDIFIADEDWSIRGKGKINGGLVLAKNTDFSRQFFGDIVASHVMGDAYKGPGPRCKNNEQLCLAAAITSYPELRDKILVASGQRWNRHPCMWSRQCPSGTPPDAKLFDPNLQVVHFMGAAKGSVHKTLYNLGLVR